MTTFNRGFARMFHPGHMSLGVFFAIEAYSGSIPTMENQVQLAQRAEALGFAALWFRDVPLHDPNFGDAGQVYDPWVYLGYIAGQTRDIALATGSVVLPLSHPLHLAKFATSVDQLSGGRLVLGVASGDRQVEYPAFNVDYQTRGEAFQATLQFMRAAWEYDFPIIESNLGRLQGADLIPKPFAAGIPMLVTGQSQQSLEWIAANGDGWIYYPRSLSAQKQSIEKWRQLTEQQATGFKPFAQSLYVDLLEDPNAPPQAMHLGFRIGRNQLLEFLCNSRDVGVNHIALNLKYGSRPAAEVLEELGQEIVPHFAFNPLSNKDTKTPVVGDAG